MGISKVICSIGVRGAPITTRRGAVKQIFARGEDRAAYAWGPVVQGGFGQDAGATQSAASGHDNFTEAHHPFQALGKPRSLGERKASGKARVGAAMKVECWIVQVGDALRAFDSKKDAQAWLSTFTVEQRISSHLWRL